MMDKDILLTSDTLHLRPVVLSDVTDAYVRWMNDAEVNRFMETRHREQTHEAVESFVRGVLANENMHFFAMVDPKDGSHIGNIKLAVTPCHGRGEISLFIGERSHWGRGLATIAISLVSDYGFAVLGLRKLTAGCYSNNVGSSRAFEKAGFEREAVIRAEYISDGKPVDRWCYCRFAAGEGG